MHTIREGLDFYFERNRTFINSEPDIVDALDSLWLILDEVVSVRNSIHRDHNEKHKKENFDEIDRVKTAFVLLNNSLTDLIFCVDQANRGVQNNPMHTLRVIVEGSAIAVSIILSEKMYEQYRDGTLNTTKAISKAKKICPIIGTIYGALSNDYLHPSHKNLGKGVAENMNGEQLWLLPPVERQGWIYYMLLVDMLSKVSLIMGQSFEFCCHIGTNSELKFLKVKDNKLEASYSISTQKAIYKISEVYGKSFNLFLDRRNNNID